MTQHSATSCWPKIRKKITINASTNCDDNRHVGDGWSSRNRSLWAYRGVAAECTRKGRQSRPGSRAAGRKACSTPSPRFYPYILLYIRINRGLGEVLPRFFPRSRASRAPYSHESHRSPCGWCRVPRRLLACGGRESASNFSIKPREDPSVN